MADLCSFTLAHFKQYQNDERFISLFTNTPESKTTFKFDVNKVLSHEPVNVLRLAQMCTEFLLYITTSAKKKSKDPNSRLADFGLAKCLVEMSVASTWLDWKLLYGMVACLKRKPVHAIEDCYLFFVQYNECLPLICRWCTELYQYAFDACFKRGNAEFSQQDSVALMHALGDFYIMTELMADKFNTERINSIKNALTKTLCSLLYTGH